MFDKKESMQISPKILYKLTFPKEVVERICVHIAEIAKARVD
jgi:hypothetical protein